MEMMKDLKEYVKDTTNETQVRDYLAKLLDGKAFDHKGLIYGLGHAIYAVSDPRAEVFRDMYRNWRKKRAAWKTLHFIPTLSAWRRN